MKPLILMLLIAITADAQSLADAARKERERQATAKTVHVYTAEDVKELPPLAPAAAPASSAVPAVPKPATPTPAVKPQEDPVKKYNEDLAKAKAKVVELQDQESALQLQINDLKNVFLAPVTDPAAQNEAKDKLAQTQADLAATQLELANAKKTAADLDAQGPPKPQ